MLDRFHRTSLFAGPLAVVLWIVGLVIYQGSTTNLSDKASDQQILAWVQGNTNKILLGGWLFALGCLCFIWFVVALRSYLLEAEAGPGTLSTIALAGGLAAAIFGLLQPGGDMALAINKNDVSPATAGALHHTSDMFFVGAELAAILLLAAVGILAFRTAILPKWWAALSLVVAVALVIGPIGWAALIFGLPIWTIGTTLILTLRRGTARRTAREPVTA